MAQMVNSLQCRRLDWNPGSGRSPAEGNGNPLQCSCLENPTDGGAWQATVHGIKRIGHNWVILLFQKLHKQIDEMIITFS